MLSAPAINGTGKSYTKTQKAWIPRKESLISFCIGMSVMYAALRIGSSPRNASTTSATFDASSSHTIPSYQYKRFQGLGFQIFTGGAPAFVTTTSSLDGTNTTKRNPECLRNVKSYGHMEGDIQCYLGLKDNGQDVQRRLDIMRSAVDRAYELASDDPTTLKIFIAPEFFWRGRNGAYAFESDAEEQANGAGSCGTVCQILQGLESIVEEERFDDWLFLFGTVIASDTLPTEDPFDYLFYNFAPLYKGGPASIKGGKRFLVPKRLVSNMDFLTPRRSFNESMTVELTDKGVPVQEGEVSTVLNPYEWNHNNYDNDMWAEYKHELHSIGYEMIEYGWFLLDRITFSVEICVDHDARRALTTYLANAASWSETLIPSGGGSVSEGVEFVKIPNHQAQISLVSSAGMSVNIDSLALADNGSILLQDGLEDTPSRFSWISKRKHLVEYEGGSEVVKRRSVLTPTDVFFEYKLNEEYESYPVFKQEGEWKEKLDGVFTKEKYEPILTVYQPSDITHADGA